MARQKGYDREDAVVKATNAFREHGYQNLGIRAIEELVGIGRFAIRTDFGGKEGLFKESLALYREEAFQNVIQPINESDNLAVLEKLFDINGNQELDSRRNFGCLLVNTMVETPTNKYPEFNVYTHGNFEDLREAVVKLLDRAKNNGTAKQEVNSIHAGEFIKGAIIAINVISRDANNVQSSASYIDMVLNTIEQWKS